MSGVGTKDGIQPGSPEAIGDAERGQQAADDLQRIRAMPRREQVRAAQAARTPAPPRSFRQRLRDAVDAFRA